MLRLVLIRKFAFSSFFLFLFFISAPVFAEVSKWTVGLTAGLYQPSLKTLNQVLQTPQIAILQDPNFQLQPNTPFRPEVRNIKIPRFKLDSAFGIEAQRRLAPRHAFIITVNVWESVREANDIAPQITGIVSELQDIPRTTRYNLSIVQLWLGWRYGLYVPSPKKQIYLDIGLIGLSFGQLTIDTLLKVADQGFPIASSLEASGWGFTTRWGLGAEYAINRWLAFSFRAAYIYGRVRELKVDRFFPSGFSTPPPEQAGGNLEPRPEEGDVISIAEVSRLGNLPNTESRENIRPLPLELNGVEVMLGIQLSF